MNIFKKLFGDPLEDARRAKEASPSTFRKNVDLKPLAQKLAVSFSAAIGQELSDQSSLEWMWAALPQPNIAVVRREWVLVQLFLRSLAFLNHSQDRKSVETLLDWFHGFALQSLTKDGVLSLDDSFERLLPQRFQDYYEAMRGSKDLQFQIMKLAERFFHHCGSVADVEAVMVATEYFLRALVAEKNLVERLEKDSVIVGSVLEAADKLIVSGYRRIAALNGFAPTARTSDDTIVEIYSRVGQAFQEAAKERHERIPALYMNTIILKFLQMYEWRFEQKDGKPGLEPGIAEKFLWEHLQYEVEKYRQEGLRADYRKELPLF